jgi:acyl carrier protein
VQLRSELSSTFGVELPATVVFNYPNIAALASYISAQLPKEPDVSADAVQTEMPERHATTLETEIQHIVASIVGFEVLPTHPLMEAGLDSLGAVELRQQLGSHFGLEVPVTVMFDYPTTAALAKFISSGLKSRSASEDPATKDVMWQSPVYEAQHQAQTTLAGLSCRYPGLATGLGTFWKAAVEGCNLPEPIPLTRWDIDHWYAPQPTSDKMYVRFGAYVGDIDKFDGQVIVQAVVV